MPLQPLFESDHAAARVSVEVAFQHEPWSATVGKFLGKTMTASKGLFTCALVVVLGGATACGGDSGSGTAGNGPTNSGGTGSTESGSTGGSGGSGAVGSTTAVFSGNNLPFDQFFTTLKQTVCGVLGRCVGNFVYTQSCLLSSSAQMEASFQPLSQAVTDGRVLYDGVAAATSIKALAAVACENYDALNQTLNDDGVFVGTVATAGNCTLNAECKGTAACFGDGVCPGKCEALRTAGGACANDAQCDSGLGCVGKACVPKLSLGQTCNSSNDACASFAECRVTSAGTYTCQSSASARRAKAAT
jgi:hypothetical protein